MDKREADIHHQYNREKFDVIIKHLEKINGRLQKAENNITGIKSIGITLYAMIGVALAWLGIKQ
tara:strand:- start:152 stop:343 length:192 start_codon:yes stop_codon:yes gene_type:complete